MRILVNGEPLEFELEGTESLKEIITTLNEWAAKGKSVITDLKVNNQPIPLEEASTSSLNVKEIEILEVELQRVDQLVHTGLLEAGDYLSRLMGAIDQVVDLTKLKEFVDGLKWIDEIISKAGNLLKLDYNKIYFNEKPIEQERVRLREVVDLLKEKIKEENIQGAKVILEDRVRAILENWIGILPKLIEQIPQPADIATLLDRLKEVSSRIPIVSKQIEEVSINLQTGEGAKAMEQFQKIIDELQAMIHLLQEVRSTFGLDYRTIKVKDQSIEERTQELDGLLSEIITAFENEDTVMLADLLEYELSPLFSRWQEVISTITTEVEKKINLF